MTAPRLGFFTRLLGDVPPAQRYRDGIEQFVHAEQLGFDTGWVAQHHFDGDEGGLPAPFVLLAQVAAATTDLVLATGIVTLPLEAPLRVAEDAAVLALLSGGRFELGIGSGGTPSSFAPFGRDAARRSEIYAEHTATLLRALRGEPLTTDGRTLHPPAPGLADSLWEATFSAGGAARIGAAGHGLMLSRTQPRPAWTGTGSAAEQVALVDAHAAAVPDGVPRRVMASRSVLVVDDEHEARAWRARAIARSLPMLAAQRIEVPSGVGDEQLATYLDLHIGTPEQVVAALTADPVLPRATDLVFQPHPVDPPHAVVLRSLELLAGRVAPALGWSPRHPARTHAGRSAA